jgi:hypothetical protein
MTKLITSNVLNVLIHVPSQVPMIAPRDMAGPQALGPADHFRRSASAMHHIEKAYFEPAGEDGDQANPLPASTLEPKMGTGKRLSL